MINYPGSTPTMSWAYGEALPQMGLRLLEKEKTVHSPQPKEMQCSEISMRKGYRLSMESIVYIYLTGSLFCQEMGYKRVCGWTSGRSLPLLNFLDCGYQHVVLLNFDVADSCRELAVSTSQARKLNLRRHSIKPGLDSRFFLKIFK